MFILKLNFFFLEISSLNFEKFKHFLKFQTKNLKIQTFSGTTRDWRPKESSVHYIRPNSEYSLFDESPPARKKTTTDISVLGTWKLFSEEGGLASSRCMQFVVANFNMAFFPPTSATFPHRDPSNKECTGGPLYQHIHPQLSESYQTYLDH